jgi:hypothetical protein
MQLFQRKAKAALHMIDKMNHNYNSVFREEEFWKQKIQTNMDKTTRHTEQNE